MPEAKTHPAPSIAIIDESFDLQKPNAYHISILAEEKNFSFAIMDTALNKFLVLQRVSYQSTEDIISFFTTSGISGNFRSVTCAVAHPAFSLIPAALFDEEQKNALLEFNHPLTSEEKIHADTLQNLDAKNLFTINRDFELQIRKQFTNARVLHNATAFMQGLLVQNKNKTGKKVFADLHSGYFEVVILEDGELIFSNAYKYKTPEDIAYYILFVYEQLHLNPEETVLMLSGEIDKTAKEQALLYNYIHHVKFAGLPDMFKYSYKFEEIQPHLFFSLFNQFLLIN